MPVAEMTYQEKNVQVSRYDEEDEVRWMAASTDASRAMRKRFYQLYAWPCLEKLMGWRDDGYTSEDITIMLILADTISATAALSIKRPEFTLSATQPSGVYGRDDGVDADGKPLLPLKIRQLIGEGLLRRFLNDDNGLYTVKDTLDMVKWNAFWAGYGVSKIVPSATWQPNSKSGKQMQTHDGVMLFDPVTGQPMLERKSRMVDQHYRITYVPSTMFLVDPKSMANLVGADWVAEEGETPIDEMREAGIYNMYDVRPSGKSLDKWDMDRDDPLEGELQEGGRADAFGSHYYSDAGLALDDPDTKLVKWYYRVDLKNKRFKMIAKSNPKKFLLNIPWPKGIEGGIHSILTFTKPDPRRFYPMPPIYPLMAPSREYNDVTRHMRIVRSGSIRKIFVTDGYFTGEQLSQLASVVDNDLIYVKNAVDAEAAYRLAKSNEAGHMTVDGLSGAKALLDFGRVGGRPAESRGEASSDLLGQTQAIIGESNIRDDDRRDRYIEFLISNGRKMWQLVQATLAIPMAIRILGKALGDFWYQVEDQSEIEGSFDVMMEADSLQHKNKAVQLKQNIEVAKVALSSDVTKPYVDGQKLLTSLKNLGGADLDWVKDSIDPMSSPTMSIPAPGMPQGGVGMSTEAQMAGQAGAGVGAGEAQVATI